MENQNQIQIVNADNISVLPEILKAEIDTQISTAKAYPRSLKNFIDKAMSMATLNEEIAASCGYSLPPRGGKSISGASVRLAEIVCSAYGNVRAGARVIANDGKTITAQGICHDLESNNCVTVEVKRRITDKNGKTFNEDMQVVTGNAACSIAYRNAVLKCVPAAFIQPIYDEVMKVSKGTVETLPAKRIKAVDFFKSQGIKEEQICDALSVKRIEDIDLEKLHVLRGMVSAVKNGEGTLKEMFELKPSKTDKTIPELTLEHPLFNGYVTALREGNVTIEAIKRRHTLSEEVESALLKQFSK